MGVELQPCEDNVLMAELQMTFFSKHLFHIEVNGNCLSIVHPNTAEASFLDEGHCLEGPDCHGISLFWCIGGNKDEGIGPKDWVRVFLEFRGGLPSAIRWERFDREARQSFVEASCQSILDAYKEEEGF